MKMSIVNSHSLTNNKPNTNELLRNHLRILIVNVRTPVIDYILEWAVLNGKITNANNITLPSVLNLNVKSPFNNPYAFMSMQKIKCYHTLKITYFTMVIYSTKSVKHLGATLDQTFFFQ